MNFKRVNKSLIGTVAATAALAGVFACTAVFSGCNVSTINDKDMELVIAEVNITEAEDFDETEIGEYSDMVKKAVPIYKRDLYSYFLNVGYSYVNNGYSYESTFTMLVDSLVQTEVLTQYSAMYLMKDKVEEEKGDRKTYIDKYNGFGEDEVGKYMYLLGYEEGDTEYPEEVSIAWYNVVTSLNASIDSFETQLLEEDEDNRGTETRSTPGNVDTERDDYFPTIPAGEETRGEYLYGVYCSVYTGNDPYLLSQTGIYQDNRDDLLEEKSTRATRVTAYSQFVGNLIENYLVDPDTEDVTDVLALDYIQIEFENQLKQQLIDKYEKLYNEDQEQKLIAEGDEDWYVKKVYEDLLDAQEESYNEGDGFADALGSMSSNSFLLYAPDPEVAEDAEHAENRYGFVYNILLPFSASQSATLSKYQVDYLTKSSEDAIPYTPEYYTARAQLLDGIETTDQRSAWFNGQTEYAFDADEAEVDYYDNGDIDQGWLFFEKNMTEPERYEMLERYAGTYPYNGSATETDETGDYVLIPNKLGIDDMLSEFAAYVDYVVGDSVTTYSTSEDYVTEFDYDNLLEDPEAELKDREIDYSKFVYATGKVDFGSESEADNRQHGLKNGEIINPDTGKKETVGDASVQYKALSAVNELQYAYTTDTSILSTYLGYSIDVGDTDYIGEFEYAAQAAIREGAGTFYVCAGDYGWHLIYVTYTFDIGEQYTPDWVNNYNVVGTFEYYFYEYVKSNDLGSVSTTRRSYISTIYNTDDTVTKYEKRYQDLLDLG